ncbi:phosphoribosyltransferase [Pseudomonas juntendi]|uniref:Phosphoribosyltransferase n=1 Tax=Pseudomonas putida TaxID=303 RepID=A0A1X0ZP79_PSEPU|nr:phosphoribosyltransferase [Pseudomonas putida]MEB3902764.1 phosphoribosyltransferase [Pseudomonas putida]ORL59980.1 phosphoribosyltransferase [Pseudomonas putida]
MNTYFSQHPVFKDRRQAGRALAQALKSRVQGQPLVLALPRGGVPVAYEVAKALAAPLDLVLVRKIGAPGNEEFAVGAVAEGNPPYCVADQAMMALFGASQDWFDAERDRQLLEIQRRRRAYCGDRPAPDVSGREVVLVDDGVATGSTARAALLALAAIGPSRLLFAAPVGAREAVAMLRPLVDELVCLEMPEPFRAVGLHYDRFEQTSDDEVVRLLAASRMG